jgi:hypothetical protein
LGVAILLGLSFSHQRVFSLPLQGPIGWLKSALSALLRRRSLGALCLLGLLNGLLPCGLVYVACAGAAATGGVVTGVSYMLVFGLGTVPMLLALGLAGHLLNASLRLRFQKLVPVCLAVVALLLILRGLALGIPYLSPDLSSEQPGAGCCH